MKFLKLLFFLGVFFLPFNSFQGFGVGGEFSRDSSVVFFLTVTVLIILLYQRTYLPIGSSIFKLLVLFSFWLIFSFILSIGQIVDYNFKETSGVNRFINQFGAYFISVFLLFTGYYTVFVKNNLQIMFFRIRKVLLLSFCIVSFYGILEFMILRLNIKFLEHLLSIFNFFPFTEVSLDYRNRRLSSVTFETPAFATYLLTVAGWMFSYIITGNGIRKYIPAALVIFFSLFCGSRSSLFIIIVQLIGFVLILAKASNFKKYLIRIFRYSLILGFFGILFFGQSALTFVKDKLSSFEIENSQLSNSNKTRFGTYTALWQGFLKYPFSGSGFGQHAYVSKDLYPDWAVDGNWEFRLKYLNENYDSFPPGYNIYLRLLAETGIVGFLLFLLFWILIFYSCVRKLKSPDQNINIMGVVLFVSMIGFFMNWFKMDTFRIYGFWIDLAFLLALNYSIRIQDKYDLRKIT